MIDPVHCGPAAPLPLAYRERVFIPHSVSEDDRAVFEIEERTADRIDTMRRYIPREVAAMAGPEAVWRILRAEYAVRLRGDR